MRVLVAEDEETIASLIAHTLENAGAVVEVVGDGRAAVEAAARLEPDVLILDLLLPIASGWQVLRALRDSGEAHLRCLPVVVVSALSSGKLRSELAGFGVEHVLGKPFGLEALRSAVSAAGSFTGSSRAVDSRATPRT